MPQIIVTADKRPDRGDGAVLLRERVTVNDFESDHYAAHLVERLGWAVGDADEVERQAHDDATHRREQDVGDVSDDETDSATQTPEKVTTWRRNG